MENKRVYSRNEYMERIDNNSIDLVDLMKYVLVRWKIILAIAVPLFLLCVFCLVLKSRNSMAEPAQVTADTLQPAAKRNLEKTLKLYEDLEDMETYKEESAYMSLNPYHCNVHTLKYLVRDRDIPSGEGYEIYKEFVEDGELKQIIDEKYGKELTQPSELINVSNNKTVELNDITGIDFNSHVLSVKIVTEDAETDQKITSSVKNAFSDYHKKMLAAIGEHDLELLSESDYVGSDIDLEDAQAKLVSDMSRLQAQIEDMEAQMSDEEKNVLESLRTLESEEKSAENRTSTETQSPSAGISKKYLLAALVLCFGFACCVIAGYYIFCGKLKRGEELIALFNLPYIGRISKKYFDSEKVMMEDELWMICSETDQKEINLFPVEKYPDGEKYLQQLGSDLKERGILLNMIQSLTVDFNMAREEKGCKNIVLLVKKYHTLYASIDKVLQKCDRWNINIVGVMDIEN